MTELFSVMSDYMSYMRLEYPINTDWFYIESFVENKLDYYFRSLQDSLDCILVPSSFY